MQRQAIPKCTVSSIGDISRTKCETNLFFNKESVPAKIIDTENDNLICFYAAQVMEESWYPENKAAKENRHHNISPSQDSVSKAQDYWYFFSPLYIGESPVACITSPEWQDGIGKVISIYTFKRMDAQQPAAKIAGYFGERIYLHGYLTQHSGGSYIYYRVTSSVDAGGILKEQPFLVGSTSQQSIHVQCRIIPDMLCKCISCRSTGAKVVMDDDTCDVAHGDVVEFHRPQLDGNRKAMPNIVISFEDSTGSMKVSKNVDLMEAILLCYAYSLYTKKSR